MKAARFSLQFTLIPWLLAAVFCLFCNSLLFAENDENIAQVPLFVTQSVTPQVMLTMSNDHQLYFEAYPDYADLTGDGAAERRYNHSIDYYGYFDFHKCYDYDATNGLFVPESITSNKYCSGNWSGNFLNYITMARIDVIRKILYGGYRSTDTNNSTVLERTNLPNDAHSWVRYYDGTDINNLTPFSHPTATVTTSSSLRSVPAGSRNADGDRRTFATGWNSTSHVQIGDQVIVHDQESSGTIWMMGIVRTFNISNGEINVQVTSSSGADATLRNNWSITNNSRQGISFCNTTYASDGTFSQNVTTPPLIRIASGNYSLWTANERHQCRWSDEVNRSGHIQMQIGGLTPYPSNGNDFSVTGIPANFDNPVRIQVGLGQHNYNVRVQACVAGLVGMERCKEYPDGNLKPVGLLQDYGDNETLHFGLLTGSYIKNKSGGVLRKNIGSMADEINVNTDGTFKTIPADGGIIGTLDRFRLYGYRHHTGTGNSDATYNSSSAGGDNCPWGLSAFTDGQCTNWGNPQSEIFLESLLYFAGKSPSADYVVSGTDSITGLPALTSWQDPLCNDTWCAALNIINFNSSVSSYDADQLTRATDIGATSTEAVTQVVGEGEGIHGQTWFVGESGALNDQLCTPKNVGNLGSAMGICPDAPRLEGSYHIAGLAHYAYTDSIRDDLVDSQNATVDIQVKTYGVALAPAVPRIEIPKPGEAAPAVTILPACRNTSVGGNCAIVDLKIISQDLANGTGAFLVQWEDSEQGGDYDMDMNGIISYSITETSITVTTNVFSQSTPNIMGFGYIINGTTQDGFQVHSGINNFNYSSGSMVPGCSSCVYNNAPTSHTYALGTSTADLLEDPLFYAAKWGGFHKPKRPQDPSFPENPLSWDASENGMPDNYYYAIDPAKLAEDLESVFKDVVETTSSASSVVANSVRLDTGTFVYQARFRTDDWSGELIAFPVNSDGSLGEMDWEAGENIADFEERNIVVFSTGQTVPFVWDELSEAQQLAIGAENATIGAMVVDYIRGDASNEVRNGGTFRNRERRLGDIINSDPVFVGVANYGYDRVSIPEGKDGVYTAFRNSISERPKMIYVSANDGMLHGFESENGTELLAFVPNEVIPNLKELTAPTYNDNHRYYVDGPTRAGDAFIDGQWRTVLVGSTGAGGRAVFALDVTNPGLFATPGTNIVLWEFTHSDLGYSIGQPTLARLMSGHWAAIFGNGYITGDTTAKLFVVDLATGEPIRIIDTNVGVAGQLNGLSTPTLVDADNNRIADYVYAGDLQGNLWKFDLTSNIPADWSVAYAGDPLFVSRDQDGNVQPITARPTVGLHPDGGFMVNFGTGRFFAMGDNNVDDVTDHQSFYGIRDNGAKVSYADDRSEALQEQQIIFEGAPPVIAGITQPDYSKQIRVVSENQVNYSTQHGWFIDLLKPVDIKQGERVVSSALLRTGRIIFTTMIPSEHPCDHGGTSWLMELDALTGARLDYSVFDLSGDGLFNEEDYVIVEIEIEGVLTQVAVPASGQKLDIGISKTPAIILGDTAEFKYFSGSREGEMQEVSEFPGDPALPGRKSWRQLR